MTKSLEGITVGLPERRFASEMATLFRHFGANLDIVPLLEERLPDDRTELTAFIERVCSRAVDIVIFTTGVGVRFLVDQAAAAGVRTEFLEGLHHVMVVARGSKTVAALSHLNVAIALRAADPTTEGIIEALRLQDLHGKRIAMQLWGASNPRLCLALETLGATVWGMQAYVYVPVSDAPEVEGFVRRILDARIDVLAFTSAPQVRPLLEAAARMGVQGDLVRVLNSDVVVAAIGEVTRRALSDFNIETRIVPSAPRMGSMASAIADFFTCEVR